VNNISQEKIVKALLFMR